MAGEAGTAVAERIVDIDVSSEMETSFLEYAYSVIYSRALPDARDGLKPVQRRILYMMSQMSLWPDRAHVKSARVVGEVMGKLHPHGDMAIYDALVRPTQDFSLRLPLIDGHGNFGSLDDGPAAPRYTEARLAPPSVAMTSSLSEDVVDFVPNYDYREQQPSVLPAAIPNLLVNGTSGIAVGMATNMAPHNLVEVIGAAQYLLAHPNATLEELMEFVPGPDLPTGGRIVGLAGVRDAYATGRGIFRTRATAKIENISARRKGIVVTELPYLVGPEKVVEKISDGVKSRKIQGISAVQDLTDRKNGLKLVIEVKAGFDPEAVLEQLYRTTPLEDSFGINNVALVNGEPQTLGLVELLRVWVNHRIEVVKRRTAYRLKRRQERQHLVEGLLLAIADIDDVIQIIRTSDDATIARTRLMDVFDLTETQANYILDLQLRRLTKFSTLELEAELAELQKQIAELQDILSNKEKLNEVVSGEMGEVAAQFGTPRRTILVDEAGTPASQSTTINLFGGTEPNPGTNQAGSSSSSRRTKASLNLEIADTPTKVVLSATGLLARVPLGATGTPGEANSDQDAPTRPRISPPRGHHDAVKSEIATTTRSEVGLVTSNGRMIKMPVVELPALPGAGNALAGGASATDVVELARGETVVGVASLAPDAPTLALGTAGGVVKRVAQGDQPNNKDEWEVIALKEGDQVVGVAEVNDDDELVFISSDSSLLHYLASAVRPQGRAAGGMAGISLAAGAQVIFFGAAPAALRPDLVVATVAGSSGQLIRGG
ncbi:MAG: DNA topoisomerase IV subunit A, partial [Promicromonosporaceae bacterium]|nr:DNA topoisomerase IV subunit A [Promicromonosporaceae bacterium]